MLVTKARIATIVKQFKELQGSPSYLAKGVAIGVFIGIAPITPLKALSILALTFIIRSSTVAAFLISAIICNPFTYIPLYYVAWLMGNFLFPGKASWSLLEATVIKIQQSSLSEAINVAGQTGYEAAIVMLSGGFILALPLAILSYPLAYRLFTLMSQHRD